MHCVRVTSTRYTLDAANAWQPSRSTDFHDGGWPDQAGAVSYLNDWREILRNDPGCIIELDTPDALEISGYYPPYSVEWPGVLTATIMTIEETDSPRWRVASAERVPALGH